MSESTFLTIYFGAFADPIGKQLKRLKLNFVNSEVKHFDKLSESITRLKYSDVISDTQARQAEKKLFKKIEKHVSKHNKKAAK